MGGKRGRREYLITMLVKYFKEMVQIQYSAQATPTVSPQKAMNISHKKSWMKTRRIWRIMKVVMKIFNL